MKKNLLKVLICIIAVSALFCAFAVMASAEVKTGSIYISRIGNGDGTIESVKYTTWGNTLRIYLTPEYAGTETDGVFDQKYNFGMKTTKDADGNVTVVNGVFYPIGQDLSTVAANLVESGLYYTFDSETGKMTITGKVKKQSDGKDVPWIIPAVDGKLSVIKEVEIAEDTGVTRLFDHCMNGCSNLKKLTIPSTVVSFENESISRTYANLKTIKVWGSELETDIDLRNLTSYDKQTFLESLSMGATLYINEYVMNCPNANVGNKSSAATMKIYAPKVEACSFASTLATGLSAGTLYTVEMYPMSPCTVKQLGYQIRTDSYNGLRSRFTREAPFGLRIANGGTVLETPEVIEVSSSEGTTVEYGVIVATNDLMNYYGYNLTKNGSTYETANTKIKKVAVDSSKVDASGYFYVSIVNYVTKAQMESKILMVPYEIKRDGSGNETVVYGLSLDASSIYDATIGMYTKGLINGSVEKDNVFWSVLDKCKYTDIQITPEGQDLLTANGDTWSYSVNADGDLVTTAGGVPLSVFKLSDGTYTAIAHKTSETTSTTFNGYSFATSDWKVETNHLSPFFLGFPIKTIIVDDGITTIGSSALKGFYDHTEGANEAKPTLEYVIYADSVNSFGGLNKAKRVKTIVPFSKAVNFTDSDWAAYDGIYDLSGFTAFCSIKYLINQSQAAKGIIFPVSSYFTALGSEFISDSAIKFQYIVGAGNTPTLPALVDGVTKKTYDLRGTGLYVPFAATEIAGEYSTTLDTFRNMWSDVIIIQDEPLAEGGSVTYKYTVTKTSSPYSATREVYTAS